MKALSQNQQDSFAATNARLGLGADEFTVSALPESGNIVFSSDPAESSVAPKFIPTASIAHLKELIGAPAGVDDSNISYPAALKSTGIHGLLTSTADQKDLVQKLSAEDMSTLHQAASAYLMGNAEKVEDYVPTINAAMFPGRVALFAGQSLNVPDGQTLVISGKDPVALNYQTITVGVNAQIRVETNAQITCQIFTQK